MATYQPRPIDNAAIELSDELRRADRAAGRERPRPLGQAADCGGLELGAGARQRGQKAPLPGPLRPAARLREAVRPRHRDGDAAGDPGARLSHRARLAASAMVPASTLSRAAAAGGAGRPRAVRLVAGDRRGRAGAPPPRPAGRLRRSGVDRRGARRWSRGRRPCPWWCRSRRARSWSACACSPARCRACSACRRASLSTATRRSRTSGVPAPLTSPTRSARRRRSRAG